MRVTPDAEFLPAAARPVGDKTLSQGPAFGRRALSLLCDAARS